MADIPVEEAVARRRGWPLLVLAVAGLAGGVLFGGALLGRVRYSDEARLDRAARAVVPRDGQAPRPVVVQGKDTMVLPPLEAYLNREHIVRLAIECGRLRRQALDALGEGADVQRGALEVAALSVFERGRVSVFLKVDEERAQLLLYAMDWPWVGRRAEDWQPAELPAPGLWPPLETISPVELDVCLDLAGRAPAWPQARELLRRERGLSDEQAFAVRAELLRRALAGAFESRRGSGRALDALAKYADLAPPQARALLAMHGALTLGRAGAAALPPLDVMARQHPDLADAVREAVRGGGL